MEENSKCECFKVDVGDDNSFVLITWYGLKIPRNKLVELLNEYAGTKSRWLIETHEDCVTAKMAYKFPAGYLLAESSEKIRIYTVAKKVAEFI